jgi:sulfur transfer protein SufE
MSEEDQERIAMEVAKHLSYFQEQHDKMVKEFNEQINWQAKYDHLVESLPKSKRPFSDKQAQKVIASQVKRITQLEDDLSFVRCELDKLRKQNPASGC